MKTLLLYLTGIFLVSGSQTYPLAQEKPYPLPDSLKHENRQQIIKNKDFNTGESLTYVCHYGPVNAGEATVTLDKRIHLKNERPCYKVDVEGKTIGAFRFGYKVKDTWTSYIDTVDIVPQEFYRDLQEGDYTLVETSSFDHQKNRVTVSSTRKGEEKPTKDFEVPMYVQDLISGYYYLRTIDFEALAEGDIISMNAFLKDKVYDFKIRYMGRKKVWTKFGKINAFEMKPIMPSNSLFVGEDAITFWVSDDSNRVPVKIETQMFLGAIEVELVNYKGFKTKLGKQK